MKRYRNLCIVIFILTLVVKDCTGQNDCPAGLYGVGCTLACTCVSVPSDTICDSTDGTCSCQPSFAGAVCDKTDLSVSVSSLQDDVYDGHKFTLVCQINLPLQDVSNYRVEFTLPNDEIVIGNLQVVDLRDTGEYRYTVDDVSIDKHTGTYRCTVGTNIPGFGLVERYDVTNINVKVPTRPSIIGGVTTASSTVLLAEWIVLSTSGEPEMTTCTVQYKQTSRPQDPYTTSISNMASTDSTRHFVSSLEVYTDYSVRLYCDNEFGRSDMVDVIQRTGVTAPESPHEVAVEDVTHTSATITWFEPFVRNGPISFYRIVLSDGNSLSVYDTPDKLTSLKIDDLESETTYKVEISAVNEDSTGQYAGPAQEEEITFDTLTFPPSHPTEVSATNGDEECVLQWKEPALPNGEVTQYTIYYTISSLAEDNDSEDETEVDSVRVVGDTLEHSFLKSMMKVNSRYDFRMSASSAVGDSELCECENVYCTTKPGAPERDSIPIPSLVQSSAQTTEDEVTKTTIRVAVNPVSKRNGPVTCYDVIVVPLHDVSEIAGGSPDDLFPPENISYYAVSQARPGYPYLALTISSDSVANGTNVVIGDDTVTQCNDTLSSTLRRKRETSAEATQRLAENGPLVAGVLYSSFVRVYVLVDNDLVEYASSSFMEPVRTDGGSRGDVLKWTIIATVALVLSFAIFGALMLLCFTLGKKKPYSRDIVETSDHTWSNPGFHDTATIDKRPDDHQIVEMQMKIQEEMHGMDEVDVHEDGASNYANDNAAYYDSDIPPDMPEIHNCMHDDEEEESEVYVEPANDEPDSPAVIDDQYDEDDDSDDEGGPPDYVNVNPKQSPQAFSKSVDDYY